MLEDPIEGDPPSRTKALPDICNRLNFEYSAFSGLKVDGIGRKSKNKKKDSKQEK